MPSVHPCAPGGTSPQGAGAAGCKGVGGCAGEEAASRHGRADGEVFWRRGGAPLAVRSAGCTPGS